MNKKLHFYSMLHIDPSQHKAVNLLTKDFNVNLQIYKANAITLSRSLSFKKIPFTLLTNRPDLLEDISEKVNVKEIQFKTSVPSGIRFYSAHFKIDAFRYFSSLEEEYSVLCDLDSICINEVPSNFKTIVEKEIPVCYDITDQAIHAYGVDTIKHTLESVRREPSEGRWCGGEFIGGTNNFYAELLSEIEKLYPIYISNMKECHHIGDEAVVSPSLENLKMKGKYIADAGTLGIISRFWSCAVKHPQKPFKWSETNFMIHLPADKLFIAKAHSWTDVELQKFVETYKKTIR